MTSSSHILLLGSNSIHSLVPSSLIAQVESLLDAHKLEDAFTVVDSRRKELEALIEIEEAQAEELRYVYQRLGFQYFKETLFEDAGNNLFNGQLDARVLISYFPQLRGNLFGPEDNVDIFAGIAEKMPQESSVDDLIRNYSPHMSPNTQSAPPTAELRKILQERALQMLETFLKKERRRRMALDLDDYEAEASDASPSSKGKEKERPKSIRVVIDTVLAKIYAQAEKTVELYDLLSSVNSVVLSEVETVFQETGQYNALCMLYQQGGSQYDEKLLEVWSRVIDGEWTDPDIPEPLLQMVSLLTEKRDKALTQKWAIWLLKQDQDAAIGLLTTLRDTAGGKRRDKERTTTGDDLTLLEQIELANPSAANQYLQYLVLQKRVQSKDLHNRLAISCIDEVLTYLRNDDAVSKLWRAKVASYSSSASSRSSKVNPMSPTPVSPQLGQTLPPSPSFFSHFASTTPESPSKRARLCCILFLSGSRLYDPEIIRTRIVQDKREKILSLEMALLAGKLGNHRLALTTLGCELNDAASAEAYCALQGDVIPPKVAVAVAEAAGLERWADALFAPTGPGVIGKVTSQGGRQMKPSNAALVHRPVDEAKRKELLKVLLEVYMSDGNPSSAERASQLLSAQAINLDVLDVLDLVPHTWSLPSLTPFLSRSFRRITHQQREAQIAKNVSFGQNLEVKESTWEPVRDAGALVEELEEDDSDEGDVDEKESLGRDRQGDGDGVYNEKQPLVVREVGTVVVEKKPPPDVAAGADDDLANDSLR